MKQKSKKNQNQKSKSDVPRKITKEDLQVTHYNPEDLKVDRYDRKELVNLTINPELGSFTESVEIENITFRRGEKVPMSRLEAQAFLEKKDHRGRAYLVQSEAED